MSPLAAWGRPLATEETAALRDLAFSSGTVIERDGLGVYGFGPVAARLPFPDGLASPASLTEAEDSLRQLGGAGVVPVALGAVPFRPDAPFELAVPEVVLLRRGDDASAIVVAAGTEPERLLEALIAKASAKDDEREPNAGPPDAFELASRRSHADFLARVQAAVDEVRTGRLDKVVLAREVVIEANRPLRQEDLLERLRSLHPSCLSFWVDGFVGASPELLVSRAGTAVASHPLAGTTPRSGDPEADRRAEAALLASPKERAEHAAVVDAIAVGLRPVVDELVVPDSPRIVELRNVSHLGTLIEGRLGEAAPSALALLARIHPTPAVAGSPADVALEYLTKAEDFDRDRYAGAVGWLAADGDGEWHLGIRSAIVSGCSARLFAGVGIVADSDPASELRETQLKLQAVLAAAVRP